MATKLLKLIPTAPTPGGNISAFNTVIFKPEYDKSRKFDARWDYNKYTLAVPSATQPGFKERLCVTALAAHPSGRWTMNGNHFQLAMLAYNRNCWLMLFHREEGAKGETLKHTTLATARLRFLFLAAKIWRQAGRVGVSYSGHYAEQRIFRRRMDRLRLIAPDGPRFGPVLATALTG